MTEMGGERESGVRFFCAGFVWRRTYLPGGLCSSSAPGRTANMHAGHPPFHTRHRMLGAWVRCVGEVRG